MIVYTVKVPVLQLIRKESGYSVRLIIKRYTPRPQASSLRHLVTSPTSQLEVVLAGYLPRLTNWMRTPNTTRTPLQRTTTAKSRYRRIRFLRAATSMVLEPNGSAQREWQRSVLTERPPSTPRPNTPRQLALAVVLAGQTPRKLRHQLVSLNRRLRESTCTAPRCTATGLETTPVLSARRLNHCIPL